MILVTGATGLVGRPLVELLVSSGMSVRAVSRAPQAARLPAGVEVVQGDPSQPMSIATALHGVTGVVLNPRAVGTAAEELLAIARKQGVRRVVALSALNVDFDLARQPSRMRGAYNKEVEAAAVSSGLEWTSLRSGWYAANSIGMWAEQIRRGTVVRSAHAAGSWAPLHEADIAAVAGRALMTDDLVGRMPVLTGPRSMTLPEMVTTIGTVIGRPLRFQEVAHADAVRELVAVGIPEPAAEGFMALQADSYGQRDLVTGAVEKILGRPGLSFADWVGAHVDAFTLNSPT